MVVQFKNIFKKKPDQETEQAQATVDPEIELREKAPEFMKAIDEIAETRNDVRTRTAALYALSVRTKHKFNNVNDYLDMLSSSRFADIYAKAQVDLKTNSILSIDKFCHSVITDQDEWHSQYATLELKEVVFDMNNDQQAEQPEQTETADNEEVTIKFNHIIKEDTDEEPIQFSESETDNAGEDGAGEGEEAGKKGKSAASRRKADKRNADGNGGSGEAGAADAGSSDSVQGAKAEDGGAGADSDGIKDVTKVANLIKKFVNKGSEITVSKSIYADGRNVGAYDIQITDENGARCYVVDGGSIIPDRLSIIVTTSNNMMMAVPIVKRERELVNKIFTAPYVMNDEEFARIFDSGVFLPDMSVYNNIDMTGSSFLYNLNSSQKKLFAKNLKFVIASLQNQGRSLRFRIQKFKNPEDFILASDSECISPVPGLFTSSDIGFIKVIFKKDQDLKIQKSDDRISKEKSAKADKKAATITSQQADDMKVEVKDHRKTA